MNIIEKLEDLLVQATKERSHYYVASVCREAIAEIKRLQATNDIQLEAIISSNKTMQRAIESFAEISKNIKKY